MSNLYTCTRGTLKSVTVLLIAANFPSPGLQDLPDYVMEKPASA